MSAHIDWLTIARKHGYAFPDDRMIKFVDELRAALAQKEAAAPGDLHASIMNMPTPQWPGPSAAPHINWMRGAWKEAKHAAAELVSAALAQPVAVDAPQGWISMADRMPPNGESVLIFYPQDVAEPYRIDMWDEWHEDPIGMGGHTVCIGEGFMSYGDDGITHWMPLPPPPIAAIDAQDGEAT